MARPPKYKDNAERQAARRQQIRRNVRAFRERNSRKNYLRDSSVSTDASSTPGDRSEPSFSAAPSPSFLITSRDSVSVSSLSEGGKEDRDQDQDQADPEVFAPSPLSTDVVRYSDSPPIDLAFGYFEGIVRQGDAWQGGYPFWAVTQLLRGDDLVLNAVLAAATAGFSILYQDSGLARQSRESLNTALQLLRQRLAKAGTVKNDPEGMGMIYANYSLTSVEFCENALQGVEGSQPWVLHLRAGFRMMESAGPWAFRDAISLGSLRTMRSRIVRLLQMEISNM